MPKKSKMEVWFDNHNHTMGFLRTVFGLISSVTGVLVFLKGFYLIRVSNMNLGSSLLMERYTTPTKDLMALRSHLSFPLKNGVKNTLIKNLHIYTS